MSEEAAASAGVADWLLLRESGGRQDTTGWAQAAEHLCRKLEGALRDIIGDEGFAALLGRAQHLAESSYPFLVGLVHTERDGCLQGLDGALAGVEPAEARRGLTGLFAHILQTLSDLITSEIVLEQVQRIWPDLPQPLLQAAMKERVR